MKIDKSLQIFIEALPHLEPLHYGFKLQASNLKGYCFCALAKCLSPWRKIHYNDNDYSVCGARHFQGPGLLQHCCSKGDEYHTATAFYLTTLFKNAMGLTHATVHHGTNDLSRKCWHFRVRQKFFLKTSLRVFPTRRPDTRTCRWHHAVSGFFLCVVFCVVSLIADMSIRAVEMS